MVGFWQEADSVRCAFARQLTNTHSRVEVSSGSPQMSFVRQTKSYSSAGENISLVQLESKSAAALAQLYLDDPGRITELEVNFRWDDVNGVDFTPKIKDQKGCGACYALATIGMLEARIKIWYGVDVELST